MNTTGDTMPITSRSCLSKKRRYYEENRETILEYGRRYHEENRAAQLESMARWRENNLERHRENARRYYREHPEASRVAGSRYRHHKRTLQGEPYGIAEMKRMYQQQGGRCYYCRSPLFGVYHIEHKRPLSRGGLDCLYNIVLSCPTCNLRKYTKTAEEFMLLVGVEGTGVVQECLF